MNAKQDAETDHGNDQAGTTVADEGQSQALRGQEPHVHAEIDEGLQPQPGADPDGEIGFEETFGIRCPQGERKYALSAPVIILPSTNPDAAPTLVQPQRDQLALLQPTEREIAGVVLDSITYDDQGAVVLSGRRIAGRAIRIYAQIQEESPDIREVMMSAYMDKGLEDAAMKRGAVDFLHKPLDMDEVLSIIREFTA